MSTAVVRGTPSLSVPPTQNTAPVIEFNCLYTHDLRRKQKRWHDGFLRYHTFNKRVMVYDVPRNFLGDLHWTEGGEIHEGDEMTLEKGGVVVQVAEEVGRTETDISGLLHRKDRSSPARTTYSPHRSLPQPFTPRPQTPAAITQAKHKSLNTLLGPSRGPIGKANFSPISPFETRNRDQENHGWEFGRETKRQRKDEWNVTRTTKAPKPLSVGAASSTRQKSGNAVAKSSTKRSDKTQQRLDVTDIIDLCSDNEPSLAETDGRDTIKPITQSLSQLASPSVRHVQRRQPPAAVEKPAVRPTKRAKQLSPVREPLECDRARTKSPPVSTTNMISASTVKLGGNPPVPEDTASQKQQKGLKLAGSAPRRMLVLQSQMSIASAPKRGSQSGIEKQKGPGGRLQSVKGSEGNESNNATLLVPETELEPQSIHRQRLQERLARIGMKGPQSDRQSVETQTGHVPKPPTTDKNLDQPEKRPSIGFPEAPNESRITPLEEIQDHVPTPADRDHRDSRGGSQRAFLHPQARARSPNPALPTPSNMAPPNRPSFSNRRRNNNAKQESVYNTRSDGVTTALLARPFKAPSAQQPLLTTTTKMTENNGREAVVEKDTDLGPWSKEASDLMDWRPPNRDNVPANE